MFLRLQGWPLNPTDKLQISSTYLILKDIAFKFIFILTE